MASLDENAPPAAAAPRPEPQAVAAERDILDDQLDLLSGSMCSASELDATAVELAGLLVEKGDDASALRAHRVLAECGVQLGLWGMGEKPELRNKDSLDKPMGAFSLKPAAPRAATKQAPPDAEADSKTPAGASSEAAAGRRARASATSLRGAPPILPADELDEPPPPPLPLASQPKSLAAFLK